MPVPVAREAGALRDALQRWFDDRLGDAGAVRVDPDLAAPQGVGNANETILFSITHGDAGDGAREDLVLRIEATTFRLFMDAPLAGQCALVSALREHTALPAPEVRWFEPDSTVLGAPFCVMTRAPGRVPTDNVAVTNWTAALSVAERRRLWENAFTTLCSIHTAPGREAAEAVLAPTLAGRTGVRQQLEYWGRYRDWGDVHDPRLDRLFDWAQAHEPAAATTGLSWGDARMENMVFGADLRCTAILDWEMASLGGPLMDLSWWLLFDRFLPGGARPEGYGRRDEALDLWRQLTGIPTTDLQWYEVFSAYRLGVITARLMALRESLGSPVADFDLIGMIVTAADEVLA